MDRVHPVRGAQVWGRLPVTFQKALLLLGLASLSVKEANSNLSLLFLAGKPLPPVFHGYFLCAWHQARPQDRGKGETTCMGLVGE